MKKIIFLVLLFCFIGVVFAHQPKLGENNTIITNPDVSEAYYSTLTGTPQTFHIHTQRDFNFYAGLLVPKIDGIDTSVSATIRKASTNELVATLNGVDHNWVVWHEEFGNDDYYFGPEVHLGIVSGDYDIEVHNNTNSGKYVLVVGEDESFGSKEIVEILYLMPLLKATFFQEPFPQYLNSPIWLVLIIPLILIILTIVFVLRRFIKKRK